MYLAQDPTQRLHDFTALAGPRCRDVADGVEAEETACVGFKDCDEVVGFTSKNGFLQTLDPNAGTAAGGDDARGAQRSLEACEGIGTLDPRSIEFRCPNPCSASVGS